MHKSSTDYKLKQSKTVSGYGQHFFSLEEASSWIMDSSNGFKYPKMNIPSIHPIKQYVCHMFKMLVTSFGAH